MDVEAKVRFLLEKVQEFERRLTAIEREMELDFVVFRTPLRERVEYLVENEHFHFGDK